MARSYTITPTRKSHGLLWWGFVGWWAVPSRLIITPLLGRRKPKGG